MKKNHSSHSHGHDSTHGHDHAHSHGHSHDHEILHVPHASFNKLRLSFFIIALFMVVEVVSGWLFNSLALISDGLHMLTDAVALGIAALAVSLGTRRATQEKTFGFKRFEILAAFANGLSLCLMAGFIVFHGVQRLAVPEAVNAWPMLWVASAGLFVNIFVAWWLHRGEEEKSLNLQGALWHVMGDLAASVAAVIAAVSIITLGWLWVDPLLSLLIAVVIALGGYRIMRKSAHILVEGTPEGVDLEDVRKTMLETRQVDSVHDLHLWTMNGRDLYLSAHVQCTAGTTSQKEVMESLTRRLSDGYAVDHITLQVDGCVGGDCLTDCETVRH